MVCTVASAFLGGNLCLCVTVILNQGYMAGADVGAATAFYTIKYMITLRLGEIIASRMPVKLLR